MLLKIDDTKYFVQNIIYLVRRRTVHYAFKDRYIFYVKGLGFLSIFLYFTFPFVHLCYFCDSLLMECSHPCLLIFNKNLGKTYPNSLWAWTDVTQLKDFYSNLHLDLDKLGLRFVFTSLSTIMRALVR